MSNLIKFLLVSFVLPSIFLTQTVSALLSDSVDDSSLSGGTCINLENNLTYGKRDSNTNGEITKLQTFLHNNNYLTSSPTGFFGLQTKTAVKAFQSKILSGVQADNIDNTMVTASSDRQELATTGFLLSNSGYVGSYTRAKIGYASCSSNLSDKSTGNSVICTMDSKMCSDGVYVFRTGPNCAFQACPTGITNPILGTEILQGPSTCVIPTYDTSSVNNSSFAANGTCEVTLTWPNVTEPLSSKIIKWQLEGSNIWSGNITLADDTLSSKSKKLILGQSKITVVISSNGQDIATKVISGVCASGSSRSVSNGRCIVTPGSTAVSTTPPTITTTTLPNAVIGSAYTNVIVSTGGTGTRTWTTTGVLPTGIQLNQVACATSTCSQPAKIGFTGSPTTAGSYTFTVTVITGSQSFSKDFTLVVTSATNCTSSANGCTATVGNLVITTGSTLHSIQSDHFWSFSPLTYTGGSGTSTWSLAGGALPATMELDPTTGIISNNKVFNKYPIEVSNHIPEGIFNFTVKVTVGSQSTTKLFSLEVRPL